MQQTDFEVEPIRASLNLNKYRPTVVVWPGPPPPISGPGSDVPDKPTKTYSLQDGETVVTRRIGDHATVHVTETDDPGTVLMKGPPFKNTDFHPQDSEMRFYPQGIDSPEHCRIEGSACAYTDGEGSYILRPNGGEQGPYPRHPRLSMPSPPTPPPIDSLQASQVSLLRFAIRRDGPSGGLVDEYHKEPGTVEPSCLTIKDSGYGESVCGSIFKDQRFTDKPPYAHFSNGETGGTEPWRKIREELDQSFLQAGAQFGEIEIGELMWAEDD
jgi:hypothetical protein